MYKNNVGAVAPKSAQKGITLIALVITIIVMLILVAVTISMAVNGGLFDYAGKAVGDTQNALNAEQELSNGGIEVDGVWYDSIDDYLAGKPAAIHGWTRSGDTFTCAHCSTTYTMGQTVGYTATGTSKLYGHKLGLTESAEAENNEIEVASQSTTWVVLGIQDTNTDGINETLLITSAAPLNVVDSETGLPMQGAAAYNNGPDEINRICKELYSNSEYGEARGMTIEDVNSALNFTPLGGLYYDGSKYYTTGDFETKLKELPEERWNAIKTNTNGTYSPDGSTTSDALGEYVVDGYFYGLSGELTLTNLVNETPTTITEIERSTIFGPYDEEAGQYTYFYWLASRGVWAYTGYACFGPGFVEDGYAGSFGSSFDSDGGEGDGVAGLRPVVSLTSKLPVSE